MVLISLKQRDINKAEETTDHADRTVPDHVIQQILTAWHFSRRLETREYCTHFQERKERLCGELSPYFPTPCHLKSSQALPPGESTG